MLFIGLVCFVLLSGVKSRNIGDDMVETPVVDNQNAPLLAMFDMTNVNKRIKAYISESFDSKMSHLVNMKLEEVLLSSKVDEDLKQHIEKMKGNLTLNFEKEIKGYVDGVHQNLTDSISEEMNSFKKSLEDIKPTTKDQNKANGDELPNTCGGVLHDLKGTICGNGLYSLNPKGLSPFRGYCNMCIAGGGWTVIQRRQDGSTNFYRGWEDYKNGFGDPTEEFWFGNEKIYKLTSGGTYQLRIELQDWNNDTRYATYNTFNLGNEASGYILTIGGYGGNAGDSMTYNNGAKFSTKDKGNSCAKSTFGAWWYKGCTYTNLNGEYLRGKTDGLNPHRGVFRRRQCGPNNSFQLKKSSPLHIITIRIE
ncbi:Fibrinogen-like protein A,Ryncolin-4,Angiopoietin-related protein 7,Angiopoietin-related protein 1,Ficolin-3,Ficolin-1-B,Techylectin-5A,Ficolin-2,Ryncolin-1,Tenascin-R,Fibrinogen-like protein 1,Angiopoietin-related protein 4,Angiopoietin-1,Tenascin-X,Fibrinogen C domain-containing protein 1-A,Tenascin-N,Ryncolin-3,Tenascin,Fibroleukin,Fibrinogen C domain-containing protein 1,Fibrinogen gamma chain,Techylectin-like protein,Ryncolin-2,Angiopoietin-related protein 6,Angiopoietin-related protein 2,Angiopoietin|uniref:Fibrinogen C-terminal domain-containing protein n=1 Tax=Mytilus coruscus TaxID=42192 RepID=A0A6J8C9N9_MYTCO|nr:Fibrinogen-like protein A,Ryncolin-4,Angiopoietin-related protein 7,Angiopoietin-related protein 1,Ficolin-3,Ficolin-1-B,Techylectin-5A,Ficolin-2,Ryncolin-1,Tenascin-R,Fibrinogen-like protein 1,Angiopoietin-related protein 4,Angiopoietin-1,Tenascin-X,Fibrinogen C domain-containing protein 1-A,Tenascin-N,Ryncolin-3,Tenascin,Fibroleukin,Fibrinogen C domain-containing protein 1,Fibrinogen gamma chain,Techylectin-like protein,Ryncolin-2,Angiopoietin-related protein 6,Angiopoietin-related protein 2,A